ncbi:hypothetical protein L3Y34_019490 [Caenorhabditis briggsae]|uniref:Uncharacterized protein n=1 Tax=Caenorhabditis briggsae TaxID=6238 RepID=A0AAE9DP40_CAEBR|nr:hypothetical protein L3Y34_019489 [Caenorhabditis briggsae]ULU08352.1 hypothetical protein L3Y34_019490 [Caenorhabditis briggsae]
MALHLKSTILLALLAATVSADFSASFRNFINATYGEARLTALARTDLGADGSYGGGNHDGLSQTNKRPIILVHGITNTAGTFTPQRNYFKSNGWTDETVYATTYGAGPAVNVINVKMECGFVQQIRNMIEAVYQFTGQKVDVIGYSLGSPIARKAIMGGICVDNVNVDLGGPLTNKVETYVSVAGANRGSGTCILPLFNACNLNNGLYCSSSFLQNINPSAPGSQHYEGNYVFSIYGPSDDKVKWSNNCGTRNSQILGADDERDNIPGNHDTILTSTVAMQKTLLDTHAF